MSDEKPTRQPVKRRKKGQPYDHSKSEFGPVPVNRRLTKGEREALRLAAEMYYIHDLSNVDVAQMSKMKQFSGISVATLASWAKAGKWDEARQVQRLHWSEALKRKLSDQVVHHRYDEVMKIKQLYDQAYSYALGGEDGVLPAPPKTFAEAAKLVVLLDQALETRRGQMLDSFGVAADGVAKALRPEANANQATQPQSQMALPEMSADEYQELAHTLMSKAFTEADGVSAERLAGTDLGELSPPISGDA